MQKIYLRITNFGSRKGCCENRIQLQIQSSSIRSVVLIALISGSETEV